MRKTDLELVEGGGVHIYQPPGARLAKILNRLEFDTAPNDPIHRFDQDIKLRIIFGRCIRNRVVNLPSAFRHVPDPYVQPHLFMAH